MEWIGVAIVAAAGVLVVFAIHSGLLREVLQAVTLRRYKDQGGHRYMGMRRTSNGGVFIEAQDLGKGVREYWGAGIGEYEWTITIRGSDVPAEQ